MWRRDRDTPQGYGRASSHARFYNTKKGASGGKPDTYEKRIMEPDFNEALEQLMWERMPLIYKPSKVEEGMA